MVVHNKFTDPVNGQEYTWPLNHSEEEEAGRERAVESTQNIAGTRTIQTQGELTPIRKTWRGVLLTDAQLTSMIDWQNRCETHTILLHDFAGGYYEGVIESFKYARKRVAANSRQPDKPWTWTYTIQFLVTRVFAGVEAGSPA